MLYKFKPIHAGEEIPSCDDVFSSKNELRQRLISYHSADWNEGEPNVPITHLSLDDLLEHGQWELVEVPYKCPLCHTGDVEHKQWMSTNLYICDMCPYLAMEYHTQKELDDLTDYLKLNS